MPKRKRKRTPPVDLEKYFNRSMAGALCFLFLTIGMGVYMLPRYRDVARGPRAVTEADLLKLNDKETPPGDYVEFRPTATTETGYGVQSRGRQVTRFLLAKVGNRWLFTEVPIDHTGDRLVGYLKPFGDESNANWQARVDVGRKFPDQPLLPYYFSGQARKTLGEAMLPLGLTFAVSVAFFVAAVIQANR
jgi:hypothetical protein